MVANRQQLNSIQILLYDSPGVVVVETDAAPVSAVPFLTYLSVRSSEKNDYNADDDGLKLLELDEDLSGFLHNTH